MAGNEVGREGMSFEVIEDMESVTMRGWRVGEVERRDGRIELCVIQLPLL
jgi:hypothetical protein